MEPNNNIGRSPNSPRRQPNRQNLLYIFYALIGIGLIAMTFFSQTSSSKEVPFSDFQTYIANNYISKVTVTSNQNYATAIVKKGSLGIVFGQDSAKYTQNPQITVHFGSSEAIEKFLSQERDNKQFTGAVYYQKENDYFNTFLYSILPIVLMIAFFIFLSRRMSGGGSGGAGGIFSVGKSKAQLFDKSSTDNKVTFRDVAGLDGAKQEVEEIVAFLRNPSRYTELGGKIPKGALLVGPPGTGKTLLAKAVAGEADVPFFSMSGSDFVEMFVGVGASRVRDLFRQAKEKSPCIIFIDEIDAIGRARGRNPNMGANDERENTLNQLLTEMDGFGTNSGVIILGATNRADILDKALLRAGRFDRQIHVELPDLHERIDIFRVHLRPVKIDSSLDIDFLARQTPGFSGADIANVCNEAALIAARKGKRTVEKQDFIDAVDRIVGGLERKTKLTTLSEKKSIAFHEAGHATVSWMLQFANPLVKVTIVPRGEALGAAWYLPEERKLTTQEHMLDQMCATLGGRAAEELFFGTPSTGALNDLEQVTKQAYAMVAYYGMSDKLPNLSYYDSTGSYEYGFSKPYSDETANLIDAEAKRIINEQFERAKQILTEHTEGHHQLAQQLIEREVIFTEDLEHIFGKRPWASRADELMSELDVNEQENKEQATHNDGTESNEEDSFLENKTMNDETE
ncbi:ATP-dependent zinc metalloprotease FtsH [Microbacter margulisiae]|uniref:ATP-dependent zinc metalloprotease FtsH n=1 Tax=Microbacter margulisiae TaxID=1350067 RepID=A0A7W5H2D1_9PORP|nr:ATP-dependent zinc metalloprotease FtsH [Microbacter margulisiae]MBB3187504.1 cell division protease FtsH [Microbacter margulisiae]